MNRQVEVVAISPRDGWGFVSTEDSLLLLRPPYSSDSQLKVTEEIVHKAIQAHGFEECSVALANTNEAVAYMKQRYTQAKQAEDHEVPSPARLRTLLEHASDDVLFGYVERARLELVPDQRYEVAEALVTEILTLKGLENRPELVKNALAILRQCREGKSRLSKLELTIAETSRETWTTRFPMVALAYELDAVKEYQEAVRARGQLLPVGS